MINATKSRPFSPTVRESSGRKTSSPDSEFSMYIENEVIETNLKKIATLYLPRDNEFS